MAGLVPAEIRALVKVIDELDYYQLLEIDPAASSSELKQAYYASSRRFHPDANRELQTDLRNAVEVIAKRIAEAYSVIRDPRRRKAYDTHLAESGGLRMQLAEAKAAWGEREQVAQTAQGRRYYRLAQQELRAGNSAAAARNLKMALTFEPENARLAEELRKLA